MLRYLHIDEGLGTNMRSSFRAIGRLSQLQQLAMLNISLATDPQPVANAVSCMPRLQVHIPVLARRCSLLVSFLCTLRRMLQGQQLLEVTDAVPLHAWQPLPSVKRPCGKAQRAHKT